MTISGEMIGLIILAFGFIASLVGWGIKYGSDKQKIESKNEMQDSQIAELKKAQAEDRKKNEEQHKEFYDNKDTVIKLGSDMDHIKKSLDEIKGLLENGRRGFNHGSN